MILFSAGLLVALILLALAGGYWPAGDNAHSICTTKECVHAAAALIEVMNEQIDPCQDFYQFACGRWPQKYPIPPDRTRFGTFDYLRRELKRNIKNILEVPESDSEPEAVRKAKRMYKACHNETSIENQSLRPLMNLLDAHGGWPVANSSWDDSSYDWMTNLAHVRRYGFSYLISVYVYADKKDSNRSILYVDQSVLGIGRIYLLDPQKYAKHVDSYRLLVTKVAQLFGAPNGTRLEMDVDDIMEFETKLASITIPPEKRRNRTRMYNNMTIGQLDTLTSGELDWLTFLNNIMEPTDMLNETEEIVVVEPSYMKALLKVVKEENNRTLANYIGWRVIKDMAWHMNTDLRKLLFDYARNISGLTSQETRWRSCAGLVNSIMGIAVGHPYVKEHFRNQSKEEAEEMISHIREAFYELIEENDWMDYKTKIMAKEKAAAMRQFIGYPSAILNQSEIDNYYHHLNVSSEHHFRNMMASGRVETLKEFDEYRKPVNKKRWISQPGIVNAFYSPTVNSITFPAGILQPPFFSANRLAAMNFGAIGTVIGHEITHGFDDKGRQLDKLGNLQDWWPPEVIDRYLERADCIRQQYASYCPSELKHNNQCVNGNNTLGENIADNGGLKEAFRAYQNWVRENGPEPRLPGLMEYSPEQLFFLSFASVWCGSFRPAALESQILYGAHSPGRYRVIGTLSNSDDFSRVFQCSASTPMNRGKDKCRLW